MLRDFFSDLLVPLDHGQIFAGVGVPGVDPAVQTETHDQIPDLVGHDRLDLVVVTIQMDRDGFLHDLIFRND